MTAKERAKALIDWCQSAEGFEAMKNRPPNKYVYLPEIILVIRDAEIARQAKIADTVFEKFSSHCDRHLIEQIVNTIRELE